MVNEIQALFNNSTNFTVSAGSLAHSIAGVGQQSTMVDNSLDANRGLSVKIFAEVKLGTNPDPDTELSLYLITGDQHPTETVYRSDGAGPTDAGITRENGDLIGTISTTSTAVTGKIVYGDWTIPDPGVEFGVILVNGSGEALDSDDDNIIIRFMIVNPEVQ